MVGAWGTEPIAVHDRVARGLDQLDVLQADLPHLVGGPFRAATHIGLMLGQRADAGNGEELLQLVDVAIALHVDEVDDLVDVVHV